MFNIKWRNIANSPSIFLFKCHGMLSWKWKWRRFVTALSLQNVTQKPAQTQTIRVMPNHKGYITSDFMSCKWHDSSLNIGFLFEHLVDLPDCQWKSLRNVLNGFDDLSCGCNKHDTLLWASKIIVWWFYDACGTHDKKIGNSLWVFNWRFGIRINIETFDEG